MVNNHLFLKIVWLRAHFWSIFGMHYIRRKILECMFNSWSIVEAFLDDSQCLIKPILLLNNSIGWADNISERFIRAVVAVDKLIRACNLIPHCNTARGRKCTSWLVVLISEILYLTSMAILMLWSIPRSPSIFATYEWRHPSKEGRILLVESRDEVLKKILHDAYVFLLKLQRVNVAVFCAPFKLWVEIFSLIWLSHCLRLRFLAPRCSLGIVVWWFWTNSSWTPCIGIWKDLYLKLSLATLLVIFLILGKDLKVHRLHRWPFLAAFALKINNFEGLNLASSCFMMKATGVFSWSPLDRRKTSMAGETSWIKGALLFFMVTTCSGFLATTTTNAERVSHHARH